MKKIILNLLFLTICVAGIVFLLLPFLETTPPPTTDLKSVSPQVTASNPLATIARRLSSLFGRPAREKKSQLLAARSGSAYTPAQPSWRNNFLLEQPAQPRPVSGAAAAEKQADAQVRQVPVPPVSAEEYGEASLLTDDGDWVLIRQVAPQTAEPGMHEVNVHENPYDRYIKQERVRRFGPPAPQTDIPDSKWARLWRPVQEFFGLAGAQPIEKSPLAFYRETGSAHQPGAALVGAERSYPSERLGRRRSSWPDITPTQWTRMNEAERQLERDRRSAAEFVEIMSGTRAAQEAAEIAATVAYPNPKDEDKRENYRNQLTEENKQAIKEGLLAAMRANAQGKQQVDELGDIMTGCENASLPKQGCNPDQSQVAGSLFSSDEIAAWQEKSRQTFLDKTHYNMPDNLPLMPVLGPTTPETIANMGGGLEEAQKAADVYDFLYDKNKCASQDCFLIPNSIQSNEQLRDALKLANMNLVTDLDNLYSPLKEEFIRYDVEKAKKQQPEDPAEQLSEEELRKQAEKKFTENAPNWIFVTSEQLKQIYDVHTLQAADPRNADSNIPVAVLYQTNPVYAEKMAQAVNGVIFGYAKEPLTTVVSSADDPRQADKETVENTSELTRDSVTDNVHTAFEEVGKVMKQAVSKGTQAGLKQGKTTSKQPSNSSRPSGKK